MVIFTPKQVLFEGNSVLKLGGMASSNAKKYAKIKLDHLPNPACETPTDFEPHISWRFHESFLPA